MNRPASLQLILYTGDPASFFVGVADGNNHNRLQNKQVATKGEGWPI